MATESQSAVLSRKVSKGTTKDKLKAANANGNKVESQTGPVTPVVSNPAVALKAAADAVLKQRESLVEQIGQVDVEADAKKKELQDQLDVLDQSFRDMGIAVPGEKRRGRRPGSKNANMGQRTTMKNGLSGPETILKVLRRRKDNRADSGEIHQILKDQGHSNPNSASAYLIREGKVKVERDKDQKRGGDFVLTAKGKQD